MAQSPGLPVVVPEAEPPSELDTIVSSKQFSPENMRKVITHLGPTIDKAVHMYVGTSVSPVVKDRARLLAAQAVRSYNPTKGANIKSHVTTTLQRLKRIAPEISDPMPAPERTRKHQLDIGNSIDVLRNEFGRDPTDEEVSELIQVPAHRVTKVRNRMRARIPTSVYEEGPGGEDSGSDVVSATRTDMDDWVDAVYHDLGPVDKLILMHRTGYRGTPKLDNLDVARKVGLTPAAVSQRAARIQARLDAFSR